MWFLKKYIYQVYPELDEALLTRVMGTAKLTIMEENSFSGDFRERMTMILIIKIAIVMISWKLFLSLFQWISLGILFPCWQIDFREQRYQEHCNLNWLEPWQKNILVKEAHCWFLSPVRLKDERWKKKIQRRDMNMEGQERTTCWHFSKNWENLPRML